MQCLIKQAGDTILVEHGNDHMLLSHISLASFLWGVGKHCRPRSDAAERGI